MTDVFIEEIVTSRFFGSCEILQFVIEIPYLRAILIVNIFIHNEKR